MRGLGAAWAAMLILPGVIRVGRNILAPFLVAVVVLLAATQSAIAVGWGKGREDTCNVAVSKSVRVTNKPLTEESAILPSLWLEHLTNLP